jgi:transcriptional regulator with XRE-family HTH domain
VEKIGEKLRAARIARGVSVVTLAKKTGLNAASIHRIEKGVREPRAETIAIITRALAKIPKLPEL